MDLCDIIRRWVIKDHHSCLGLLRINCRYGRFNLTLATANRLIPLVLQPPVEAAIVSVEARDNFVSQSRDQDRVIHYRF
jgi:hypothetical protein